MIEITPGNRDVVRAQTLPGRVDGYYAAPSAFKVRPGWNDARKADPDYPAHVRRLADIMKVEGFHRDRPLSVAPDADGSLYVTDGHSRLEAVLLANSEGAGIEAIPFIAEERGTTEDDRIFNTFSKNTGRPLTPLGEAINIKRLLVRGVPLEEVARRLAYSIAVLNARLDLMASPEPIKEAVQTGQMSASLAVATVRQHKGRAVDVLQAAKAEAKASGNAKITPATVARVVAPTNGPSDKAMLDWLIAQPVTVDLLNRAGVGRFYAVTYHAPDGVSQVRGEGLTGRDAIADAMSKEGQ